MIAMPLKSYTDFCRPVSDLASRRALRSSARGELLVPRARSALNLRATKEGGTHPS